MIVCHCKAVSDKEIKELCKNGCSTVEDIQKRCNACTDCQSCLITIEKILVDEK